MRVGIGYDIHRLTRGRRLFLGGVEFGGPRGLAGHSDGDVVIHAVMDALLGSVAAGDIGSRFPTTDRRYKGIRSTRLLRLVAGIVSKAGYVIGNIDVMVIAEGPRIGPFRSRMSQAIAGSLGVGADSVSIKATTNERVGSLGSGAAIAAYAVALVQAAPALRKKTRRKER